MPDERSAFALERRLLMPTYLRAPITVVRGEGTRVWDDAGNEYLDFTSGLCVNTLGHCPRPIIDAVTAQLERLLHATNGVYTWPQLELAELLVAHSPLDRVFLANSGAEANECALKLARLWGHKKRHGAHRIIASETGFHGRTLGTISATGHERFRAGFEPLLPGMDRVRYNDLDALREAMTGDTAAVLIEPMQGVAGVTPADAAYLRGVRDLCDERQVLLILDEIQTGIGRTGALWAHEHYGITPDVMTVAKGLGGGLPIGACLAREDVATCFEIGDHASTCGGNPVTCAAAVAVLREVVDRDLAGRARRLGDEIGTRLEAIAARPGSGIAAVRGRGLWFGIELADDRALDVFRRCLARGVIVIWSASRRTLRVAPPLTVTDAECERFLAVFADAVAEGSPA